MLNSCNLLQQIQIPRNTKPMASILNIWSLFQHGAIFCMLTRIFLFLNITGFNNNSPKLWCIFFVSKQWLTYWLKTTPFKTKCVSQVKTEHKLYSKCFGWHRNTAFDRQFPHSQNHEVHYLQITNPPTTPKFTKWWNAAGQTTADSLCACSKRALPRSPPRPPV